MSFKIRRAENADATKIIDAHRRSIREVCSKDYSPEQIAVWSSRIFQAKRWQQTIDCDFVWVISDSEKNVYGFGHLQIKNNREAVIAGLYLAPEVVGKGFGKKLITTMISECKKQEISKINLSATKTAEAFYKKVGFQQIGESSLIEIGGQRIDCLNMEMMLP